MTLLDKSYGSRFGRLIVLTVALGALTAVFATDSAVATAPTYVNHQTVAKGFKTMKSTLVDAQQQKLSLFVSNNPGILSVTCTGYTGYNYLNKAPRHIKMLAKKRARNACNFIESELGRDIDTTIRAVTTSSQRASARKVVVEFTYTNDTIYQFSWNVSDAGVIYIGASTPVTVDSVVYQPEIPEDHIGGDVIPGDDNFGWSNLFIANAGATYFGGWSTTPDGTGTMYWGGSGSVLPDAEPGIVTLYAIYIQG